MICPDTVFQDLKRSAAAAAENRLEWKVGSDLPYLDGHFPGTPILPAIAMVDASAQIAKSALKLEKMRLTNVTQAKFLSPIMPGQELRIEWNFPEKGKAEFEWKEKSSERVLASMTLEYHD